jgi:hypothetical protein
MDAEPEVSPPFRFRSRHLFVLTFLVALVLLVGVIAESEYQKAIRDIDLYYGKMAVQDGNMTREQARERFGPVADTWPDPPKAIAR